MTRIIFPKFDNYVCDGEFVEVEHEGFRLRATVYADNHMGPPWKEHCGHGPVSEWTTRAKRSGERILRQDGLNFLYYDFKGAMEKARKEEWGPLIPWRTPAIARTVAAEQDFEAMKAWAQGDWTWCGVALTVWKAGICLNGKYGSALWGIERNYPGSDNSYLSEVASDLVDEAMAEAQDTLLKLAA